MTHCAPPSPPAVAVPGGLSNSRRTGWIRSRIGRETKNRLLARVIVSMVLVTGPTAAEDLKDPAAALLTPKVRKVAAQGLRFLANQQSEDGSFGRSMYAENVGVCGLAGIAFLCEGSTPGRGTYGVPINRCVDYLLRHCQENGFVNAPRASSHGPMYGHGFATLFLAEVYGMSPREDLRDKLTKAVKLIIDSQNEQGGWRYQPQRRDADISVTVCQIMALRAAKNAGIYVPKETVDRCIGYVKQCQNTDGGFMYTLDGGPSAFPRSAAGVVALYSAGIYEGDEVERGLAYLMQDLPGESSQTRQSYFFYGHYYAVQAMWHAGGSRWQRWYPAISEHLMARQAEDGSWVSTISPEYGTAMATIILLLPNNSVPILQR